MHARNQHEHKQVGSAFYRRPAGTCGAGEKSAAGNGSALFPDTATIQRRNQAREDVHATSLAAPQQLHAYLDSHMNDIEHDRSSSSHSTITYASNDDDYALSGSEITSKSLSASNACVTAAAANAAHTHSAMGHRANDAAVPGSTFYDNKGEPIVSNTEVLYSRYGGPRPAAPLPISSTTSLAGLPAKAAASSSALYNRFATMHGAQAVQHSDAGSQSSLQTLLQSQCQAQQLAALQARRQRALTEQHGIAQNQETNEQQQHEQQHEQQQQQHHHHCNHHHHHHHHSRHTSGDDSARQYFKQDLGTAPVTGFMSKAELRVAQVKAIAQKIFQQQQIQCKDLRQAMVGSNEEQHLAQMQQLQEARRQQYAVFTTLASTSSSSVLPLSLPIPPNVAVYEHGHFAHLSSRTSSAHQAATAMYIRSNARHRHQQAAGTDLAVPSSKATYSTCAAVHSQQEQRPASSDASAAVSALTAMQISISPIGQLPQDNKKRSRSHRSFCSHASACPSETHIAGDELPPAETNSQHWIECQERLLGEEQMMEATTSYINDSAYCPGGSAKTQTVAKAPNALYIPYAAQPARLSTVAQACAPALADAGPLASDYRAYTRTSSSFRAIRTPQALTEANEILEGLVIPDGVQYMPVSQQSFVFQAGITWHFSPFTIALGSSYFQRLLEVVPSLAWAVRHHPKYRDYSKYMAEASGFGEADPFLAHYSLFPQYSQDATLQTIQLTCVYLAAKVADRLPHGRMLPRMISQIYCTPISAEQAHSVESRILTDLQWRLGPLFEEDSMPDLSSDSDDHMLPANPRHRKAAIADKIDVL